MSSLTYEDALARSAAVAPGTVTYSLHLRLNSGETYSGVSQMSFYIAHIHDLFLDYTRGTLTALLVNGKQASLDNYNGSRIMLPRKLLRLGKNTVVTAFDSVYDKDGNGLMSFMDSNNVQYVYTQFDPFYASRMFPLFDQPDIKATIQLSVVVPERWKVMSNQEQYKRAQFDLDEYLERVKPHKKALAKKMLEGVSGQMSMFNETKPISSYMLSFVAGEMAEIRLPITHNVPAHYCVQFVRNSFEQMAPNLLDDQASMRPKRTSLIDI